MRVEMLPLTQITKEALRVLYCELGIVNTVRVLNQFTTGLGNYTEERRALIENQTLDEVLADLRKYQAHLATRPQDSVHQSS